MKGLGKASITLPSGCLPNHHHSIVTEFSYQGNTVYCSVNIYYIPSSDGFNEEKIANGLFMPGI